MKNILTFILIFVSLIVNAQSSLDKRFILVAEWDGNTILNDSMWRMNVLFAEDQLNGGYLPTQIQVGYLALDATGRRYRVKNIVDATFSTAILDVVEEEDLNMPPIGVGIVYVKNLTDIIHSVVHSNTQISPSLMSKIFIHNMVKIDEVALVSSDYTRLLQDSIVVYYANNAEIGRDTIRLNIVSDLANLADVDITGVADKSILYYDLASQMWRDTTSNVYVSGSGSANRIPIYNGNTSITSNSNLTFDGTTFNANSAAVFNDAGAAVDFRVESDNDANKLFVSGATDRVGIGTNAPTNTLDIDGTLRIRNLNSVTSTGILGVDANGVAERITIGTGLNLTNDVLTATGTLSGSGTSNRVAFWSGTTSLSGNDSLFYDSANGRLGIGGITNPRVGLEVNSDQIVVASNVWTSGNLSSETTWNKIHYADGKFVVVGNDNRVAVSYDGKIWNYYAVPDSNNWVGLTYGEGLWVAVASAGSTRRIMTSNDAINWTPLNYNISNVRGVIYGDKLFVIHASGQTFFKSFDGINWSSFIVPISAIWISGVYINGVYMFVNDNTTSMVVSTDGNTWSTKANSGRGLSISYGNGMYISVGTNRRIRYSYNFDTWTEYTYTPSIGNLVDIQYNDGIFLTLSSTGVIITSVDGLNWVQKTSGVTESFLSAAYGNGLWNCLVSTGTIRNITSGKVSSYYNGKNNNYFGKHSFLGEISFNELVADQIVYRTNIWTQGTLSSSTIWNDVHYADGKFVAVGNDNQVALSNDGRTWNYYAVPDSNNWVKVTYGQGLWVAVANAGSTRRIMTSNDGITWNPITFNSAIINIIYGNGAFIAIRSGFTSSISFDGITWQNITLPVSVSWATGLYINGTYYIFSNSGTTAALSTDGINWTSFTAISSSSLAYGDGVVVSINGTNVRYSYDLITWQTPLLPVSATWNNVKYNDGIFVVISTNGSIITSKDGINWFLKESNVTNNLTGITYGNGLWMIVSNNGDNRNITSGKYESILYPIGDVFYNNFRITRNVSIGTSNQPAYSLDIPTTNAIRIPSGTTLQRPVGATGVLRYNTSDNRLEFHNGTTWENPINGSGTTNELTYFSGSTTLTSSPRIKFETDGGLVLKNTAEPVSSTFVASQDFSTNTNWTEGTGWSITGGLATATAATGALTYTPTVTITSGRAYLVTVTQSGYSAGTATIALGNVTSALPQYNVTSWAVLLRPTTSTGGFRFTTSTYTGSLDNVSILEITPGTVLQAFETSASGTNNIPIVSPNPSTLAVGGGGVYNTATNNLFLGVNAGQNNTSATNNLFLGTNAGQNNTTGGSNIFIGANVGLNNTTGNSNLFIGLNAGLSNTIGGSNAFIGADAGRSNTTGGSNMFIGLSAGRTNISGNSNLFIGSSAGFSNTIGGSNSFIGGAAGFSNTEGNENTFVGVNSGRSNITAGINTFVGSNSGRFNTTGNQNTFIGSSAGLNNTTGVSNTFVGTYAGLNNTTGNSNIFLGLFTGQNNTSGNNNVFIGNLVGSINTTGSSNVFLGNDAGRRINAGGNLTISNTSVMIGNDTRALADNSSNEVVIGSGGRGNGNNTVTIGNSSITAHYLSGTGAVRVPTGTSLNRPSDNTQGFFRFNTNTLQIETNTGTSWRRVVDIADANASTGDVVSFTGTSYAAVAQRRGITTLTTDASGDITLSITMPDATYSAVAIPDGQTFYVITAHTKTTSSVKFRIFDSTGSVVPSGTSVAINYNITDY